jgi:uncharacterized protein (TIGR02118 family)
MHKLVVLYPFPQEETKFRAHYESRHLPLARQIPGLIACRYSLSVDGIGGGAKPYFAIFEADFPDLPTMGAGMESAVGQAVAADVANFAITAPIIIHYEVEG